MSVSAEATDATPDWLLHREAALCPCGCIGKRRKGSYVEKTLTAGADVLVRCAANLALAAVSGLPVWFFIKRVWLFDELSAALDPRTSEWLTELIEDLAGAGKTVVLATHHLDSLDPLADRCIVFSEQHVVDRGQPRRGAR